MEPIKFEGYQRVIGAPKGMLNCGSMPIHQDGEGVIFAWKMSPEELAEANRTGGIIFGKTSSGDLVYPMYLSVFNPLRKRIFYKTDMNKTVMIFISEEGLTPPISFTYQSDIYKLDTILPPIVDQTYILRDGDLLLRRVSTDFIESSGPENELICMRNGMQDLFICDDISF